MKKLSQQQEQNILDYLDGKLNRAQAGAFEQTLKENVSLKSRFDEIKTANILLKQISIEEPSRNFTFTVMSRLDQYPARTGISIRNGIMLLSGILVLMAIAVFLVSSGYFDQQSTLDLNKMQFAQLYIKQTLPSIALNGKMIVNTIVMLNLVLAFIVLDRTILRPLFHKRMHTGQ
jgi:hypothetical protein